MKLLRPTTDHERHALKITTKRALQMANGPESFMQVTRVKSPALSKYCSRSEEDSFLPIDVALDLDRDIGSPVIAEALAQAQGYKLVRDEAQCCQPLCHSDVARIMREAVGVTDALSAALEDGKITPEENRLFQREASELIDLIRKLQQRADAAAQGSGS